jgi:1-deoxy-D-xylulose-5-phosphate reductoisomerase
VAAHLGWAVESLSVLSRIDELEEQIRRFSPRFVVVYEEEAAQRLRARSPGVPVLSGMEGLLEQAADPEAHFALFAMSGSLGIAPTLRAIRSGKRIGIANKEILVSAGEIVMREAAAASVPVLPVDSEHSALFQCLLGEKREAVSRLILTASGGPFRGLPLSALAHITPQQAAAHPNWKMGQKVSIDCSTLMNKGLEMIEARWLFGVFPEQIEAVIHPQSVVHSLVEFVDGSIKAQVGAPDMRLPIQYAFTYPERVEGIGRRFQITDVPRWEFTPCDLETFRCLKLAIEAMRAGGSAPCALNAANEVLVARFIRGEIGWLQIGEKLEKILSSHQIENLLTFETIQEVDRRTRAAAERV